MISHFLIVTALAATAPIAGQPTSVTNAPAAAPEFQPTDPLRNPFWPVDFDYDEKDLQSITTVPIVDLNQPTPEDEERIGASAAAAAALARSSRVISARSWAEATKALHFKGKTSIVDVMTGKRRTAFFINGNTYGIGDFISVNHEGHRFTWRIRQRTDMETLMLEQIRVIRLPDEEDQKKEGKSK